jgi:hypothetical protein
VVIVGVGATALPLAAAAAPSSTADPTSLPPAMAGSKP